MQNNFTKYWSNKYFFTHKEYGINRLRIPGIFANKERREYRITLFSRYDKNFEEIHFTIQEFMNIFNALLLINDDLTQQEYISLWKDFINKYLLDYNNDRKTYNKLISSILLDTFGNKEIINNIQTIKSWFSPDNNEKYLFELRKHILDDDTECLGIQITFAQKSLYSFITYKE